ncbi:MAG TPA: hypothetical protein VMH39_13890, partial [Gemmatimonadaceae bacterium]|nr:hypothetical protein [Gemmatimonadaceae bacterium]
KSRFDVIIMPSDVGVTGGGGGRGGGRGGGGRAGAPPGDSGAAAAAGALAGRGGRGAAGGRGAGGAGAGGGGGRGAANADAGLPPLPDSILHMEGGYSGAVTLPALKQFLEDGGTIISFGGASEFGTALGLPITDHMIDKSTGSHLNPNQFYAPGSVLRVAVDNTLPIATGLPKQLDVFYNNSPVYDLGPDAAAKGLKPIAWYDTDSPLRSGWAWGGAALKDGVEGIQATVGKGNLYLFGMEIMWRGEPHGTFKFLFNGIYATN